jgi:L-asparaginase II
MPDAPTAMVEVTRGDVVESRHYGSAAVFNLAGPVWRHGDVTTPVYPRSAIKPIQALPLIETGAAARFGLDDRHIALACASHGGEPAHVSLVQGWLGALNLDVTSLECGSQWPMYEPATLELARSGAAPTAMHNNCSGKHAGMLCAAIHCGDGVENYVEAGHPSQRRWIEALSEVAEFDLRPAPRAIDGCSIPTIALPLTALANGFARMADDRAFVGARREAIGWVRRAMAAEPFLVAGTGRCCTRIMTATQGRVLVKVGAEGVYTGMIPEVGLGFAVKIEDGAFRAAEVAVVALVRRSLGPAHALSIALAPLTEIPIQTRRGLVVGVARPARAFAMG